MSAIETYSERPPVVDPYTRFAGSPPQPVMQGRRRLTIDTNFTLRSAAHPLRSLRFVQRLRRPKFLGMERLTDPYEALEELLKHWSGAKPDLYGELQNFDYHFHLNNTGVWAEACINERLATPLPTTPKGVFDLKAFLEPVLRLVKSEQIDRALDVLYERMDNLLLKKEFNAMNSLLEQVNVGSLSVDVLLGLLTASLPARSRLPARKKFFSEVESSIKARGIWESGLLDGLE